ncbi:hypothetical protein A6A08_01020 [Nocardiopsis sp. TSRI0078]|uniref:winged helix-turn-helix transcriptional regulator n=1 Tax=unclassified Nocardiopsis TaxID=2649073 RepID=UPI0009394C65|nr:winged helix-turn-helix transcriptional regulator [Nocardiopsis sp. TSRI0078]OKI23414.1 hypothetical protein A6A08_01020 [Nocardiopsis sp. TSRI0078]
MTNYTVTVIRDEDLWAVSIDGLPKNVAGVADYLRFSEIKDEVPEFIADLTDSDPEDFTITWRYEFGGEDVTEEVLQYLVAEEEFRRSQDERDRNRTRVLETLQKAGITQRAMADVVDLSPQRVQQLLSGTDKSAHRGRGGRRPRTPAA